MSVLKKKVTGIEVLTQLGTIVGFLTSFNRINTLSECFKANIKIIFQTVKISFSTEQSMKRATDTQACGQYGLKEHSWLGFSFGSFLLFVIRVYHVFWSVHCSVVVTCWEKADLFALLCLMFYCVFVTSPCGVLDKVWYLIVSISDLCILSYFYVGTTGHCYILKI